MHDALITCRSSRRRGPVCASGRCGWIAAHCTSLSRNKGNTTHPPPFARANRRAAPTSTGYRPWNGASMDRRTLSISRAGPCQVEVQSGCSPMSVSCAALRSLSPGSAGRKARASPVCRRAARPRTARAQAGRYHGSVTREGWNHEVSADPRISSLPHRPSLRLKLDGWRTVGRNLGMAAARSAGGFGRNQGFCAIPELWVQRRHDRCASQSSSRRAPRPPSRPAGWWMYSPVSGVSTSAGRARIRPPYP
jgi:hypothetical protein